MKQLKGWAVALAVVGMVLPRGEVMATGKRTPTRPASTAAPATAAGQDVALTTGGTLTGQVVNGEGRGLDGAVVSVRQGGKEVGRGVTNEEGFFSVPGLRGGVYQVEAAGTTQVYRAWTENTAPPAARQQTLIVARDTTLRGQEVYEEDQYGVGGGYYYGLDGVTLVMTGAALGGLAVGIVALVKVNDLEDDVDDLAASP